jgi:hypothetical protein
MSAVRAGFLVAVALTLVGFVVGFPAVGIFGGVGAGSHLAARRAGSAGALHGVSVSVLTLIAVVVILAIGGASYPYMDSVNKISLMWAVAVLLVGPAVGLATTE